MMVTREITSKLTFKRANSCKVILNEFGAFIFIFRTHPAVAGAYKRIRFQPGLQRFKTFPALGSKITLTLGYKDETSFGKFY